MELVKEKNNNIKVCFAASSGGHLEEIACLRKIEKNYDTFLITEKGKFDEVKFTDKIYYLKQINRKEFFFIFKFLIIFLKSFFIVFKENPNFIISTGALATIPVCLIGKIMGKKVIYIESFARIDKPSMTGKIIYKFADLFIVQWEEMLDYYPEAIYGGGIF